MEFELFYCETYSCRLAPVQCVKRQKIARAGYVTNLSPDGRQYWRCRDCAQGREVAAGNVATAPLSVEQPKPTERRETMETRICSDPNCAHAGEARPTDEFGAHPISKRPMSICKECMARRIAEGREKKKRDRAAKAAPPKPDGKKKTPAAQLGNKCVAVDFASRPDLLEWLKSTAAEELRTPENQLLWLVRNQAEGGSLGSEGSVVCG